MILIKACFEVEAIRVLCTLGEGQVLHLGGEGAGWRIAVNLAHAGRRQGHYSMCASVVGTILES